MARSQNGIGAKTSSSTRTTRHQTGITSTVSNGCKPDAAAVLTRSFEQLGYDPGRIRVSDGDSKRQSVAILERDRQVVVTLDGARVTISSPANDSASQEAGSKAAVRAADPVTVLHQSLISAGIRPGALRDKDETKFTAA
jgi:hypothetical protein